MYIKKKKKKTTISYLKQNFNMQTNNGTMAI